MSNNKLSSVEWVIDRIKNQHLYPFVPLDKLEEQAKARHKQEVLNFAIKCAFNSEGNFIQQYNETFGGNNEQQ